MISTDLSVLLALGQGNENKGLIYWYLCLVCKVLLSLAHHIFQQQAMWSHTIKKSFVFKIPPSLIYALSQQKSLALHQRHLSVVGGKKMATSKNHSKVIKRRKNRDREQPEDTARAPSELAQGTSKTSSSPKEQGNKRRKAFSQVFFPLHGRTSLSTSFPLPDSPIGGRWIQGCEVPTFKVTSRVHVGSHSAATWTLKPPT